MTASPTATDGFRRRSGSSPLLPPLATLYHSHEPHSALSDTKHRSHSIENHIAANESARKPSEKLASCTGPEIRSREHTVDGEYLWDHPNTGYKRKWSESNSLSPRQSYGLQKSDIDAIIECTTVISNSLAPNMKTNTSMHPLPRSMPSSPVASTISAEERSIIGPNEQFLGLEEGDLDRLVSKATQVVDIFEKAKKRLNSSPNSINSAYISSPSNSDQPMLQNETLEELAEISSQRRAIAMAGARSKPDLGTSSISMFRYADHSKKKHKRAGTEKLQCHSCKSTETPEWRKGPMGPRTLCNACGLIWAKLARKKTQLGDRYKWAAGDSPQARFSGLEDQIFQHTSDLNILNTQLNPTSPIPSTVDKALSSNLPDGHSGSQSRTISSSIGNTSPKQHENTTTNQHTRTDKFKLSFLMD
ncbi:hypothetical protein INT43_003277 [Umbelopsis isabellina]|uniref:GATA-type domain-containing protein n=1 Tax=Mortierella isabellina TaxID=91625 RepID=A0A8H7PR81_MORIS|nr:hypothetical protein INT43_003277 [Umbelopsis isabellina]